MDYFQILMVPKKKKKTNSIKSKVLRRKTIGRTDLSGQGIICGVVYFLDVAVV